MADNMTAGKRLIDPAPIISKLADRCLRARGLECSLLGEVIDMLHAAPAAGDKWVPTAKRKPEYAGRYLCNVESFAFPGNYYLTILMYDDYGFIEGKIYTDSVTHWMPLPEAPEVK